jgi:hypothetical protein
MAGGGFVEPEGDHAPDYGGGVTFSVVVTCLMAASCGLIFGYDIGVSGTCLMNLPPFAIWFALVFYAQT